MAKLLSYEEKGTWIHRLSGITKLIFFLIWCALSALTYDTRILLVMILISLIAFACSRTKWKQVGSVFRVIMVFMVLNLAAIFIMSPEQGCVIYGTRKVLFHIAGHYSMTREQLFYMFNVMIKYFTVIPAVFIFLVTTNPSELAASMNRVGVPYTISYALSIALRYIPDVQGDFHRIRNAQEARGIEMSAKARLGERIRRTASIIFPLLFSSMERIEVVSNAMELRSFGKNKKRTWYAMKPLGRNDRLVLIGTVLFFIAGIVITYADGSRFWAYWL